jgi:beta-glucosidase
MKKMLLVIILLVCVGGLTLAQNLQKGSVPKDAIYKNPAYSIDERLEDLLSRMTLDEKLAQFNEGMTPVEKGEIGVGSYGFMTMHLSPAEAVREYNRLQKLQIENTRLGIPATRSGEGIFAYMGNGSTSFPSPIGLAATFDPECVAQMSTILAKEMKSRGIRQVLAPVVNLTRDPRWGRTNETYGEDPYLSGIMGAAYVQPMEAAGLSTMMKHFVSNMGLDGQFTGPVHFSERLLRENYFPAFKACVDAGVSSVMMAYNTLDGIPCATHPWLIKDILKGEWNFQGYVSTDGGSSEFIFNEHGVYETSEDLAVALMNAGCDMSSPSSFYQEPLRNALKQDRVKMNQIDDAMRRILRQKFESGIFEDPYADPDEAERMNDHPEHRKAALEIARKTLVLLKNENHTLPFSKDVTNVAVVGPLADWLMVGHYGGYGRHEVTVIEGVKNLLPQAKVRYEKGVEMKYFAYPAINPKYWVGKIKAEYFENVDLSGNPKYTRMEDKIEYDWKSASPEGLPFDNFSIRWTGKIKSLLSGKVKIGATIDDGVRVWFDSKLIIDMWSGGARRLAEAEVDLEKGKIYDLKMEYFDNGFRAYAQLGWNIDVGENIPKAVQLAEESDVIIVVVGMYENENWDRADLDLAEEQECMILELAKLEKPLVVIIQSGTVITTYDWIDKVDAVMVAWYPGCEGGNAIVQAIFGDYNPCGKLPITFPKVTGQVPLNYNMLQKGKGSIKFIGDFNEPQFCFGHGVSYTEFEYRDLKLFAEKIGVQDTLHLSFFVTNIGERDGDEVPQLYIHDKYASVSQPLKKLCDFKRISLKSGASCKVKFTLTPEKLKIWDINMNHVVEPGEFEVMIGASSNDIRLRDNFWVVE